MLFSKTTSADAYPKVVDRLLASPHYGERWAQHWLDLVRYAETDGFKADDLRPEAYRYRDYVIRIFQRRSALRPLRPPTNRRRRAGAGQCGRPDRHRLTIASGPTSTTPPTWNSGARKSSTT